MALRVEDVYPDVFPDMLQHPGTYAPDGTFRDKRVFDQQQAASKKGEGGQAPPVCSPPNIRAGRGDLVLVICEWGVRLSRSPLLAAGSKPKLKVGRPSGKADGEQRKKRACKLCRTKGCPASNGKGACTGNGS